MNLTNKTFPYPVLGSHDDILPEPSMPDVDVSKDVSAYYFKIQLDYDNEEIKQLVESDFADYVCEVSCDSTKYKKVYKGKSLRFEISLPRKSVANKVSFACTITVKKPIKNYVNKGFHPKYKGHTFNMEPGDYLGILGEFYYHANTKDR